MTRLLACHTLLGSLIAPTKAASRIPPGWYVTDNRTVYGIDGFPIHYITMAPLPDTPFNVSHPRADDIMRIADQQREDIEAATRAGETSRSRREAFYKRKIERIEELKHRQA